VRLFKTLVKLTLLAVVVAAVAGVIVLLRRPASTPVSFEHWPDVPRKNAA